MPRVAGETAALRTSEAFPQRTSKFPQRCLIPPIPHPKPELLRFHHSGLGQNRHMVRNGRLGQVNTLLNVGCAQPHVLADRTSALFLESVQYPPPGGVSDGVEDTIQFVLGHGSKQ